LSIRILTLVILLFTSVSSYAENKQLFLLKQETPGHIVYASLITDGKSAIANIAGMGASTIKKDVEITLEEFNYLWGIANSSELMAFEFKSGEIKDLSDPKFYTISLRVGSNDKTYLRLPVENLEGTTKELVSKIKGIINSES